jgi:hypothetical protein
MLQQQRSACEEQQPGWWTLDSNVREAKERLDQKLRSQRESAVVVVKRCSSDTPSVFKWLTPLTF